MTVPHGDIVAVGARTPVGRNAEGSAAAIRAGISRCRATAFLAPNGDAVMAAADDGIEPALEGRERMLALAKSVLTEVGAKVGASRQEHAVPYRVFLALPEARPGFSDHDAAWVVAGLRALIADVGVDLQLVGRGHAGALIAAERAHAECVRGSGALHVVLGVDSYHHGDTYLWLERERRLTQSGVRGGFTPGEGCGAFVLAGSDTRRRLAFPCLAVIHAVASSRETLLRNSETGSFGVGMSQAVSAALSGLVLPRDAIDTLYTDINGEGYRSEEWGFVALRTPHAWKSHVYEAPSDCWGDVGAAFGALAAVLAVSSFRRRYARGPRALVMAGSDSGTRAAMLLVDADPST